MEVDDRPNRPKKPMLTYWVIAIIVFLILNTFVFPNLFRRQVEQTDYSTFLQMIEEKNIGEVSVEDTQITFSDKSGGHIYKTGTMNDPDLVNRLEEAGAVFSKPIVQQMGMLEYMLLSYILPIALFALLGWFLSRKMMSKMGDGESMMTFGMGGGSKSNAKVYVKSVDGIKFKDVAGEEEAEWQQQNAPAANSVANVPKADSSSGGAASSSGARSGSGSVREPSALQTESLPASSSDAPASTQPVSGRVLNSYSGDELVYSKTLGDWRTHNGVDYAADRGAEVTAPAAGKVVEIGTDDKWGPMVAIEDASGRVWRVCGTTDAKVKKGDTVSAGQTIGKVGSVSCECAEESHIHLEVMEGEKYLDPIKAMK